MGSGKQMGSDKAGFGVAEPARILGGLIDRGCRLPMSPLFFAPGGFALIDPCLVDPCLD